MHRKFENAGLAGALKGLWSDTHAYLYRRIEQKYTYISVSGPNSPPPPSPLNKKRPKTAEFTEEDIKPNAIIKWILTNQIGRSEF